jgi:hypothetical protein
MHVISRKKLLKFAEEHSEALAGFFRLPPELFDRA